MADDPAGPTINTEEPVEEGGGPPAATAAAAAEALAAPELEAAGSEASDAALLEPETGPLAPETETSFKGEDEDKEAVLHDEDMKCEGSKVEEDGDHKDAEGQHQVVGKSEEDDEAVKSEEESEDMEEDEDVKMDMTTMVKTEDIATATVDDRDHGVKDLEDLEGHTVRSATARGETVKGEDAATCIPDDPDWINPETIDWSALTPAETEKMQKKLRRQEKRKRKREEGGPKEKEKKKHKKDKKDKDRKGKKDKDKKGDAASVVKGEGVHVPVPIDSEAPAPDAAVASSSAAAVAAAPAEPELPLDPLNSGLSLAENFRTILGTLKKPRHAAIAVSLLDEKSNRLIEKMQDAHKKDQQALERGEPGVMKLRLLDEVKSAMSKAYLLEFLMKRGDRAMSILDCFADWLQPVEVRGKKGKKQLPNLNVRTALLDILLKLPLQNDLGKVQKRDDLAWEGVGKDDLEATKIGHRVSLLAKHPLETQENRHKAEQIIERWSRLLFNNTRDYKKLGEADAMRGRVPDMLPEMEWKDPLQTLPPELIYTNDAATELEARKERYKRRIRLPQRQMMNFHFRPKSEFTPDDLEKREKTQSQKERLLAMVKHHATELKAANKLGARSRVMSIEGSLSTLPQGPV